MGYCDELPCGCCTHIFWLLIIPSVQDAPYPTKLHSADSSSTQVAELYHIGCLPLPYLNPHPQSFGWTSLMTAVTLHGNPDTDNLKPEHALLMLCSWLVVPACAQQSITCRPYTACTAHWLCHAPAAGHGVHLWAGVGAMDMDNHAKLLCSNSYMRDIDGIYASSCCTK